MPLRRYKCDKCGKERETLKKGVPECCELKMEEVLEAPKTKLMVKANKATGRSKMKDMDKVLKERARNHARDVEGHDIIQKSGINQITAANQLNDKGEKRKKADDL